MSIELRLGDIILLHAPENNIYNDKTYLIDYLDSIRIDIIDIEDGTNDIIYIDENTKKIKEESITQIDILDRALERGYAKQNGLIPETWIDVYIGGEIPLVITGRISNLEEDMIEITTFPEKEQIYIDFKYKGLPDELFIDNIIIREKTNWFRN